jgi:hypothetical protein
MQLEIEVADHQDRADEQHDHGVEQDVRLAWSDDEGRQVVRRERMESFRHR